MRDNEAVRAPAAAASNVGGAERTASMIGGAVLIVGAIARLSLPQAVLLLGGAALLWRGITGYCPLYRRLGVDTAHEPASADPDNVELASEDSFPASDPPSWTPTTGTAIPH